MHKSETVKKTLNPEWNESFEVQVVSSFACLTCFHLMVMLASQPSRVGADFQLEVFDWNQIEKAKSLGRAKLELADLEPFVGIDRTISLSHQKHGEQGEIRVKLLFTPEIIGRHRTKTSTFSSAGRAMTQIGGLPIHGVREVGHGVGKVGGAVGGIFRRDHAKNGSGENDESMTSEDPPSTQVSMVQGANGMVFPAKDSPVDSVQSHVPSTSGILRVTVMGAKDLPMHDGDTPKPYVVVRSGDKEFKTKHSSKTVAPEWYRSFFVFLESMLIWHLVGTRR